MDPCPRNIIIRIQFVGVHGTAKLLMAPSLVSRIQGNNLCNGEDDQETKTKNKQGASKVEEASKYITERGLIALKYKKCL